MTPPTNFQPARVYTTWGTVLYISEEGELRHGDDRVAPANAYLSRRGRNVQISCNGVEGDRGIDFPKDGLGPPRAVHGHGALLRLVPLERGLFGLRCRDNYLCAEPDGSITATKVRCSTWEFFLGSEMWCGSDIGVGSTAGIDNIDLYSLRRYIVEPATRMKTGIRSNRPRVLIYGYPYWSHGRVYYDVMKRYWRSDIIIDIANWQVDHSSYFHELLDYYDLVVTAPDGVKTLLDAYHVDPGRMIIISHHENDIRMLTDQKGRDVFDQFCAYGVVSYYVYCASMMQGVQRKPNVVSLGVAFDDFFEPISSNLRVAGYASSMSAVTYGVEWKRGYLAEAAAKRAGVDFKVAGSTGDQVSFHDMPQFYKGVDAVLTSSISEAAQLPCMEGAAAGRLVIGTPVGHFPLRAYQGGGIIAPIEEEKFISFVSGTLSYFRDNPIEYQNTCQRIQESAHQFDWANCFSEWLELLSQAEQRLASCGAV